MNQEKIGKFIKDLRVKEGLTQEAFANMFGVTYQAVSKWENGKNMPDISILKSISKKFNVSIDDLLEGYNNKKSKNKILIPILIALFIIIIGLLVYFIIYEKNNHNIELNPINTTCSNFKITGSAAYNSDKASIYIYNITYCGNEDKNVYDKIECSLYENYEDKITLVSSSQEGINTNLTDYLENLSLKVDNYNSSCKNFKKSSLYLEISAYINEDITTYKIPITLEDNC